MGIESIGDLGIQTIVPKVFSDERGYFSETYNQSDQRFAALNVSFVQDNQVYSSKSGTVRGLHFQKPPFQQGKLVRVVVGAIFDVAVDIRSGSPTYGRHVSFEIDARNGVQIWIPPGFAHGYCTLEPGTVVLYKTTAYYAPECDGGVQWDDPELGIAWPVTRAQAVLSDKDIRLPAIRDLVPAFIYP